jgi:hypothetical protein
MVAFDPIEARGIRIAVNRFGAIPYKQRFALAISAEAARTSAIPLVGTRSRTAFREGTYHHSARGTGLRWINVRVARIPVKAQHR